MKIVKILSSISIAVMLISGCKSVSDEEALKSCLNNNDANGAKRAAKRMIASGADVNMRTIRGIAPLHLAAITDDIEFAQLLISQKADVNVKDVNGFTPLNVATEPGHDGSTKMVELLLKHGADPNSNSKMISPLMSACQNGYYEIVKLLVENGVDVNWADDGKNTALLAAIDLKTIKYLISKGADIKTKNIDGRTLLMQVVWGGKENDDEKTEMILMLLKKGLEINAVEQSAMELKYGLDPTPYTALDRAFSPEQSKEIISLLRSKGAKTASELKAEKPTPVTDDKANVNAVSHPEGQKVGVNANIDESPGSNSASDKAALNDSNPKTNEPNMQMSSNTVKDPAVMQIIQSAEKKRLNIKGYTAEVERQILDVNGGFDKFIEEQTVRCPDQMLVKGKVAAAHNRSDIGKSIISVIDGSNLYSRYGDITGGKSSFKEFEQNGGPSLRLYMAYLGNLADPFAIYKMDTLKLESENANEWVMTADYKLLPAMPYWLPRWTNRITIDKKSGLIKKLEALTIELGPVILLDVKRVSTFTNASDIPESTFKIE